MRRALVNPGGSRNGGKTETANRETNGFETETGESESETIKRQDETRTQRLDQSKSRPGGAARRETNR
jgi:hypothetical protein